MINRKVEYNVNKSEVHRTLGKNIRRWRKKHGLTMSDLAEKMEVSDSFLGLVERGKRSFGFVRLLEFCNIAGLSIDDLLREDH